MIETQKLLIDLDNLTDGEKEEMMKLGILSESKSIKAYKYPEVHLDRPPIEKFAVHAPSVINEAYNYKKPSSFSRALRLDFGDYKVLLISGTASVNEEGKPEHIGDFKAQQWRTYRNITCIFLLSMIMMVYPGSVGQAGEDIRLVSGQTVYVPIYTHIYSGLKGRPFELAATLSIRNTDPKHSITIVSVEFYDTEGTLIENYVDTPLQLAVLASTRYVIKEGEKKSGGSGAGRMGWFRVNGTCGTRSAGFSQGGNDVCRTYRGSLRGSGRCCGRRFS